MPLFAAIAAALAAFFSSPAGIFAMGGVDGVCIGVCAKGCIDEFEKQKTTRGAPPPYVPDASVRYVGKVVTDPEDSSLLPSARLVSSVTTSPGCR